MLIRYKYIPGYRRDARYYGLFMFPYFNRDINVFFDYPSKELPYIEKCAECIANLQESEIKQALQKTVDYFAWLKDYKNRGFEPQSKGEVYQREYERKKILRLKNIPENLTSESIFKHITPLELWPRWICAHKTWADRESDNLDFFIEFEAEFDDRYNYSFFWCFKDAKLSCVAGSKKI
jgi:hypothetical protein